MKQIRFTCWLPIGFVVLAVAGCQSEGSEWKKHFDDSALKPPSSAVEERFGHGPVEITLLVPRGSTGIYDDAARDVRDGAALAAAELGDAEITVRVADTSGGAAAAKVAGETAAGRKSGLFLAYASAEATSALASISASDRPPIINLSDPVAGENVFNFGSGDIEAAAKAFAAAGAFSGKSVFVLAPASLSMDQEKRLGTLIHQAGGQQVSVSRSQGQTDSAGEPLTSNNNAVKAAGVILVYGAAADSAVLAGIRRLNPTAQLLGNEGWSRGALVSPAAEGALIAASEQDGSALIGDRFKRHKGRALTPNAARAYDSVAIGAGLVRAGGAEAITASALASPVGFRGVSGVFRFTANGVVERQLGVFKIQGGKLVSLQAASASF